MAKIEVSLSLLRSAWYKLAVFALSKIICIPFIRRPFQRLNDPNYYGIENSINLRIPVESGEELGAWFIRPHKQGSLSSIDRWKSLSSTNVTSTSILKDKRQQCGTKIESVEPSAGVCLSDSKVSEIYLSEPNETVILYLHGNAETRSHGHRRELYKRFQALGIVVLAPDYRSYADSYGGFMFRTSESSMAWDAEMCFKFLKKFIHPNSKVIV